MAKTGSFLAPPLAKSKAAIHDVFLGQLATLRDQATAIANAGVNAGQRPWMLPLPFGWNGDTSDHKGLVLPFDRDSITINYVDCLNGEESGTTADTMALKIQSDWIASMERAFRTRHASPIRQWMHSAGHRAGHGHEQGLMNKILTYIQNVIREGQPAGAP